MFIAHLVYSRYGGPEDGKTQTIHVKQPKQDTYMVRTQLYVGGINMVIIILFSKLNVRVWWKNPIASAILFQFSFLIFELPFDNLFFES